ncbi:ATP-dependent metallopeptidase FtsH/Yme1/Tma family protein [Lentzea alba]|uniref:ATP-dependent metallopeptidase FtsH/Yme1/Tma family protein n=1 Tax=Lentzea alba TaxID=2714351 RepID=UPI0039BF1FFD
MSRAAKSGPPSDPAPSAPPARPSRWWSWLALLVTLAFLVLMFWPSQWSIQVSSLSYTDFVSKVDGNQVVSVTIDDHGSVRGTLRDGSAFVLVKRQPRDPARVHGVAQLSPLRQQCGLTASRWPRDESDRN